MTKLYTVLSNRSQNTEDGWDIEECNISTLKEARARAKYFLTPAYQRSSESSIPLTYAAIMDANGKCIADFFANS